MFPRKLYALLSLICAGIFSFSTFGITNSYDKYVNIGDADTALLLTPLPPQWTYISENDQPLPSEDSWWKTFNDTTLNSLINRAIQQNYNLASAMKRIELARNQINITRSGYWPTIDAQAGWQKSKASGATVSPVTASTSSSYFSLGLSANWEIDLFGRIHSQLKADKNTVNVNRADYEAAMITLCANLAKAYIQLRTYQTQRAVALQHIAKQETILKITEARHEAGLGNMLEVTQSRILLLSTQATIPKLEAAIASTANSIAVLMGVYPAEITPVLLKDAVLPNINGFPVTGVPADLLRRRPDIVAVECQLAEYAALIGVAKKDFLPVLTINGSIGTSARKFDNLFGKHSMDYSIAPTLSWTVFDGLARNYKLAEARLEMEQAIDDYNSTVLNAVEEVDNSICSYNAAYRECNLYGDLITESEKSLGYALSLYKQGLTAYSDVADAQQSYLENQNSEVEARGNMLAALVTLYEAMGGGF